MVEYATTECATCHAIRPKNEMREVVVRRVTGTSYGSGTAQSNTQSRSSSSGGQRSPRSRAGSSSGSRSHSNSRTHMSSQRIWVCKGCKAPRSDLSPPARNMLLVGFGALGFVIWSYFGGSSPGGQSTTSEAMAVDQPSSKLTSGNLERDSANVSSDPSYNAAPDELSQDDAELRSNEAQSYDRSEMEKTAGSRSEETEPSSPYTAAEVAGQTLNDPDASPDEPAFCANISAEGRANAAYMATMRESGCR